VTGYNVVLGATGTGFDVRLGANRFVGRWSPLLGRHQLYAVLVALAVGTHFEIPLAEALKALTTIAPLPGRMNPLNGVKGALLIDDSDSATPNRRSRRSTGCTPSPMKTPRDLHLRRHG